MNGSRNDQDAVSMLFDAERVLRLFHGLRREAVDLAPPMIRESILRVVSSVERNERPDMDDLAAALVWTLHRRARSRDVKKKKKASVVRSAPRSSERWAQDSEDAPIPAPPRPGPSKKEETVFARRLDAQEDLRASENSSIRKVVRRLGVRPSRVATDASGRRVRITGDPT